MAVVHNSRVDLRVGNDGTQALIVRPDDDKKYPAVVMVQEWWGIEPHVMGLANQLALEGFVVVVPDLYHGKVATEPNDAMRLLMLLRDNVDRAVNEIISALDTAKSLPNTETTKPGLIGFCLGGFLTYTTAAKYADLGAAMPFYGGSYDPTPAEVAKVTAPVFAVYGSQDDSIPADQRAKIESLYKEAGKNFTMRVYDAGHAFMNPDHGAGNAAAAADIWPQMVKFLQDNIK
ncbi:MAG TPA: dienelactone hydrolase family protein [Dictyobacter sp.]|jgi:carboxymethylenebutenolidase|nr:dienelactone hydrolase family protein [Dictyobacter sp.]